MSLHEALLLIGHGSTRYPDAGDAMRRHAESLRASGHFGQVEVAVLNGPPSVSEALAAIDKLVIRVVPFFMEDGYFSRVAVPEAVGAVATAPVMVEGPANPVMLREAWPPRRPGGRPSTALSVSARRALEGGPEPVVGRASDRARQIILCPPIGVHDGMAGVIKRQALVACADLGIPSHTAAVVVVGHGSASGPGRALALHRHASRVASTTLFARVEAACLEETPFVADTLRGLRSHPVVAIGFFANQGRHVRDDLPALIAAEQAARGDSGLVLHFHGSVIDDPAVVPIVLEQAMRVPRGE